VAVPRSAWLHLNICKQTSTAFWHSNLRVRSNLMPFGNCALHDSGIIIDIAVVLTVQEECGLHVRGLEEIQNVSANVSPNIHKS
jgi:hypothetical protein